MKRESRSGDRGGFFVGTCGIWCIWQTSPPGPRPWPRQRELQRQFTNHQNWLRGWYARHCWPVLSGHFHHVVQRGSRRRQTFFEILYRV